jgi:hypothetical protein
MNSSKETNHSTEVAVEVEAAEVEEEAAVAEAVLQEVVVLLADKEPDLKVLQEFKAASEVADNNNNLDAVLVTIR